MFILNDLWLSKQIGKWWQVKLSGDLKVWLGEE